ncbi:MAG: NAD(P)/FAD-dependent oxidoreductase [Gammaproteobacteria bacterium]
MTRIVILGAGIGGLTTAMELKPLLREEENITVISDTATVNFNPTNHWLALDIYKPQDMAIDLGWLLAQHEVGFIQQRATKVLPRQKRIELADGMAAEYDVLVIATGPRPAFEAIPGFGPHAYTHSICSVSDAGETGKAWEAFVRDPGPVVIGAVQGASNITAAYEYAMIADADLRRRGIRAQTLLLFVTPEPYLGHRGCGGADDCCVQLENEFLARDIAWIAGAKVERIEDGKLYITEVDAEGRERRGREIPFKHCMLMPAFMGVEALQGVEGLVNPQGFVLVDEQQRNPNFPDVYAVGVCVDIPGCENAPVPLGTPKTGYMIESMARTAAANIRAQLDGLQPTLQADRNPYPQDPDMTEFDKPWVNSVGGLYAPHLWQQMTDVENFSR